MRRGPIEARFFGGQIRGLTGSSTAMRRGPIEAMPGTEAKIRVLEVIHGHAPWPH